MARNLHIVNTRSKWNGYYGVPDYEVRRCRVLGLDMLIRYVDSTGHLVYQFIVRNHELRGERTGIFRRTIFDGELIEYEVINFADNDAVRRPHRRPAVAD